MWCAVALVSAVTGSTARAEERASVVQEQQPELKRTLVTQSGRLLAAGDANGALAKAEAAVQAEPQSGFAHYCKAEALAALNQHEAAVGAYESRGGQAARCRRAGALAGHLGQGPGPAGHRPV